jgi:hypothetical protein
MQGRFLAVGLSPYTLDQKLDKWGAVERLEARVWEKVNGVISISQLVQRIKGKTSRKVLVPCNNYSFG